MIDVLWNSANLRPCMHGVKIDASIISHVSKRGHENLYSWRWNFYSCYQFVETFEVRLTGAICLKQKWLTYTTYTTCRYIWCFGGDLLSNMFNFKVSLGVLRIFLKGNVEGVKDILEVRFWWAGAGPPMQSNSFQNTCAVCWGLISIGGVCELPIGKPEQGNGVLIRLLPAASSQPTKSDNLSLQPRSTCWHLLGILSMRIGRGWFLLGVCESFQ